MVRRSLDGTLPGLADLLAGKARTITSNASELAKAGLTVGQYADGWLSSSEVRKLESWESVESLVRVHLLPAPVTLGGAKVALRDVPIKLVDRHQMKELVFHLDEMARRGIGPNGRSFQAKTACNVWSVATSMFGDAEDSKDPRLQCIIENPCVKVRGPDPPGKKNKVYLYPAEFLLLMNCAAIPFEWRAFHALAVYLFARVGELRPLTATDIDLDRGLARLHRAQQRGTRAKAGKIKLPKNRRARWVPLEKPIMPLLRALVEARPTGPLLRLKELASGKHLAALAREHLVLAGIDQNRLDELLAHDATRQRLRFHDWRATGITWLAYRGVPALHIMQRSGHQSYEVLMEYVREAENLRNTNFGEPFPSLPDALFTGLREELGLPKVRAVGTLENQMEAPISSVPISFTRTMPPMTFETAAPMMFGALATSPWVLDPFAIGQTFGHNFLQLPEIIVEAPGIEPGSGSS